MIIVQHPIRRAGCVVGEEPLFRVWPDPELASVCLLGEGLHPRPLQARAREVSVVKPMLALRGAVANAPRDAMAS